MMLTDDQAGRFWPKIATMSDPDDCWLWFGGLTAAGYGMFGLGGRSAGTAYVHRIMYEEIYGPIPDGLHIDHLCRVRRCVNPFHLEAVTQGENNRRAAVARRQAQQRAALRASFPVFGSV